MPQSTGDCGIRRCYTKLTLAQIALANGLLRDERGKGQGVTETREGSVEVRVSRFESLFHVVLRFAGLESGVGEQQKEKLGVVIICWL